MKVGSRYEWSERCAWQARKLAEAAEPRQDEEEAPRGCARPEGENNETDSEVYPAPGPLSRKGQICQR